MEENLKQQSSDIIKIALFGPESTGKTTLAKQLAQHFDTVWAPEFARNYLQNKWGKSQEICSPDDLLPIAIGQTQTENSALLTANKLLFCDTCLLATKVFSEIYYNFCDPVLDKAARKHKYDLFFLTDIDVPWQKDDLRDSPDERHAHFEIFKNALIENGKPFIILSGDEKSRFEKAIAIIESLEGAKEMGFTSQDFVQIYERGITIDTIQKQLEIFRSGIPKVVLVKPATCNDGIVKLSDKEFEAFSDYFEEKKDLLKLEKFVPASGAASRMFKFLNEFLNNFDIEQDTINGYINRKKANNLSIFLAGIEKFPFFDFVMKNLNETFPDFNTWNRYKKMYYFIKFLIDSQHLDYANKPKGILPFHKYNGHIATPIEEHLNESAYYSTSNKISNMHFTVSENHRDLFENVINSIKDKIEKKAKTTINISYSFQNKSTDTIAVDMENDPFRDENGALVFRPGGHGALIENLQNIDADIVFIKNIDNVIQNNIEKIALYKKGLAGILIKMQQQLFQFLQAIDRQEITEINIDEIVVFLREKLNVSMTDDFHKYTHENQIIEIKNTLNRPIRVCGMVLNEGEPGGGPFWLREENGTVSLQIVETSQIDLANSDQVKILAGATHFNPVDLVCGIKNYKKEKFDLRQYIDHNSGFIVEKNNSGTPVKGYELPGLWNGGMAKWLTVFVEVPLLTFNPVKTVNDLLKPAHQPQ